MRTRLSRIALLALVAASTTVATLGPIASGTAHADPYLDGVVAVASGQAQPADLIEGILNPPPPPPDHPLAPLAGFKDPAQIPGLLSGGLDAAALGGALGSFTQPTPR